MDAMDAVCGVLGRLLKKETSEEDVLIISEEGVSGYVSKVVLPHLGDLVFEGEECDTEEASRAAALRVCLEAFASTSDLAKEGLKTAKKPPPKPSANGQYQGCTIDLEQDPIVQEPAAKRARTEVPLPIGRIDVPRPKAKIKAKPKPSVLDLDGPEYNSSKSQLHAIISKMIGYSATKAELKYDVEEVQEGYQATVTILPLGGQVIAGYPSQRKQEAEMSAADVTIQWLQKECPTAFRNSPSAPRGTRVSAPRVVPPPKGRTSQKRPYSEIDACTVVTAIPPKNKKVVRTTSSASIQVPEGLDFCLQWRESRLEPCLVEEIQDPASIEYYFGQVCLVCQAVVSVKGWAAHAHGKKHRERLMMQPVKLRMEVERPLPSPPFNLLGAEHFLSHGSWNLQDDEGQFPAILTLGEMDFSFSLAVARLRPPDTPLVATSFLAEHDPTEPEVYPSDDGERAAYKRVSLPGMKGALQKNINELKQLGSQVLHSVDATDLQGTLRTQGIEGGFHIVVFPFPRYSLSRAPNPCNSRLLREFFASAMNGVVLEGGLIQLVMLSSQYEDWDVNGMANDVGMKLTSRVQLPPNFYQPREMSGKPWAPSGAELLTFEAG